MAKLCRQWGYENPIAFMNAVPPWVINFWIAYDELEQEQRKGNKGEMQDPIAVLKQYEARGA